MNIELTVIDENAPSDKYPQWGFSIYFKDDNGVVYYAEYPNYKSIPFEFIKGEKYNFDCSIKEVKSLLASYKKISRIKNIVQLKVDISHLKSNNLQILCRKRVLKCGIKG